MTLITEIIRSLRDEPGEWAVNGRAELSRVKPYPVSFSINTLHRLYYARGWGMSRKIGPIARYRLRQAIRKWESRDAG